MSLNNLFAPRSIALIGVSRTPGRIGYNILSNLVSSKFPGKIFAINPAGGNVLGYEIHTHLSNVSADFIDLAIIAVPAEKVFDALVDCAKKKIPFVSIVSSGFAEAGNHEEEKRLVDFAKKSGIRILGPNIFGMYVASTPMNASFGPSDISPGELAIITQSGALGISMIGKTKSVGIGLSAIISVGNKADLCESDFLEYLSQDPATKVIFMYLESVSDGERFLKILKETTRHKPVVLMKTGRSKRGAMAAASHTGALAGSDALFDDLMKQCGVFRAKTLREAINWCRYLVLTQNLKGEECLIVTNGGGIGVVATDACEEYNVSLYDDQDELKKNFAHMIPSYGSTKNPVDITGQGGIDAYEKSLIQAFSMPNVHSIIALLCESSIMKTDTLFDCIMRVHGQFKDTKPCVYSLFGGRNVEDLIIKLNEHGVPVFADVYEAISCLGRLYEHWRRKNEKLNPIVRGEAQSLGDASDIIDHARKEGRTFLNSTECSSLLETAGIRMPRGEIVRDASDLNELDPKWKQFPFPAVMKLISPDILHKSDAGGVVLNINNVKEAKEAFEKILKNIRSFKKDARIDGVELREMIHGGVEILIGLKRDKQFGPVLACGYGGIYVEVFKDIKFAGSLPLDSFQIKTLLSKTHVYKLLEGARGKASCDIEALVESIQKACSLFLANPQIKDLELNPVCVFEDGCGAIALDARVMI